MYPVNNNRSKWTTIHNYPNTKYQQYQQYQYQKIVPYITKDCPLYDCPLYDFLAQCLRFE